MSNEPAPFKLRDVIEGAMAGAMPEFGIRVSPKAGYGAELVETIVRRLERAYSIELDDGTLFVRRMRGSARDLRGRGGDTTIEWIDP